MSNTAVLVENVSKCYSGNRYVLKDINLSVEEGEMVLISGPSGCGKTTLLNMMGGLDMPTDGKILIDNKEITSMSENGLAKVRLHHIGFVFQSYNLIRDMTVFENVALPRKLAHLDYHNRVRYLLKRFNLIKLANKYPHEISGGEAQRVAIARALANQPKVVLADEPTGNLDPKSTEKVMDTFKLMNEMFNTTLIIVSHESRIRKWTNSHYVLENKKLIPVQE